MGKKNRNSSTLTADQVERINEILRTGKRVELIPVRHGVRVVAIVRIDKPCCKPDS